MTKRDYWKIVFSTMNMKLSQWHNIKSNITIKNLSIIHLKNNRNIIIILKHTVFLYNLSIFSPFMTFISQHLPSLILLHYKILPKTLACFIWNNECKNSLDAWLPLITVFLGLSISIKKILSQIWFKNTKIRCWTN